MQVAAATDGTDELNIGDNNMNGKEEKGLTADDVQSQIDAALKAQADKNEEAKKAAEEQEALIAAEVE